MRALALSVCVFCLVACSAKQLYPGPPRPDHEVGTITLQQGSLMVDGVSEGLSSGFKVLPGPHSFGLSFSFSDPVPGVPCRVERRFDQTSFDECIRQRNRDYDRNGTSSEVCNKWRFMERYEICLENVYQGSCTGNLAVSPGAEYDFSWQRSEFTKVAVYLNGAEARQRDIKYSCSVSAPREQESERQID